MAKLRFGNIVADIRGSIDGITYSRNRFAPYARTRVSPVQPRTAAQLLVRSNLTSIATAWRTLDDTQRTAWNNLGASISRLNSQGLPYTLTGFQAYQLVNGYRLLAGQALTATAPVLGPVNDVTPTALAADTDDVISLSFTPTPFTGQRLLIEATAAVSQGRNFFRPSDYRRLLITSAGPTSPLSLGANYTPVWGTLAGMTSQRLSFRVTPLTADFLPGTPQRIDTIVAAA